MLLIKNAETYAPEYLGKKDILTGGGAILAIADRLSDIEGAEIIDADSKWVFPGFIDQHVHVTGAGGKNGFVSMTPELTASELAVCGTTTVVGLLGTDGAARSIKTLYAKVKALEQQGLTAYMYTGYYGVDPVHILDSIQEEMIFIDKVLGCKIAISDVRSSYPTDLELLRILKQVRVGGMIASKKGIMHIHLGGLKTCMDPLFRMVEDYEFPIEHISPTHVGRTKTIFESAKAFAKMGGMIDITTGASKYTDPHLSVLEAINEGVSIDKITFSSDGNAGLEKRDASGKVIGLRRAPVDQNYAEVVALIREGSLSVSDAIKPITLNPAINLGLKQKGRIAVGADADFCFVDPSNFELTDVIGRGEVLKKNGNVTINEPFS
ncbi:MAG: beta-aspartyl-peptidase [Flavobacteriales bacterium]|nr:beta-aspartyl-peptidase [Flavobacteriales bacterium]